MHSISSCLLLLVCLLWHGPYHEQIRTINKQLETNPYNPELYLQRAQLYEYDSQIDSAVLDYKYVLELDSNLIIANFLCARLYHHHHKPDSATLFIDRYLEKTITQSEGKLLKAAILLSQGEYPRASALFENTINTIPPRPDYFLQLSEGAYQYTPEKAEEVLHWLYRGLDYLPDNVILLEALVDMAIRVKEYDIAMQHLERVMSFFQRKEKWYFKKAEILFARGKKKEAIEALELTLETIDALPLHIQKKPFVLDLDTKAVLLLLEHKK